MGGCRFLRGSKAGMEMGRGPGRPRDLRDTSPAQPLPEPPRAPRSVPARPPRAAVAGCLYTPVQTQKAERPARAPRPA